ncbi:MAG: GDSL-type esterase/lipase family protein [Chloroflexota bacterium]|nr:GDSL-type esterase/lipase family protein [Chloroflexota bacterium]
MPATGPAASPTPAPALKPPLTYVALGASDAAGVGVEDPTRDNWVAVLGRRLPQPTRVINLGIPGIRLQEAVEVELPPALDGKPDLVTVWLVVNDVLSGVPLDRYRASLERLLAELRAGTGAQVAVGNIPNAPEQSSYLGIPSAVRPALTASWNEAIAGAVQEHGAILVDLYGRWPVVEHPEYIGPDGLHPTVVGYRTLAETFLQVLRERRIV